MAAEVNLDALISREDFEVVAEAGPGQLTQTIKINDLEQGSFFYNSLRKPDFQRETVDWDKKKICDFVLSFLEGDLIPAIILWSSGRFTFVIDGSHRLSGLIAWVQDDYGDGSLSHEFFDGRISSDQLASADDTRKYIKKNIGSYDDYKRSVQFPDSFTKTINERASRLGSLALQLQWVKGDAQKAEASFFKINQQASPIDPTEIKILQSRRCANALASRAIMRAGSGHKYWSKYDEAVKVRIEEVAKLINSALFMPPLRKPIKTLDIPVAGRNTSSQALPLIFDLVNITNDLLDAEEKDKVEEDGDGSVTVKYLERTNKIVSRITGSHPSSLGLHPAVYFHSITGRYQITAFFAVVAMMVDFERRQYFRKFTECRGALEEFLISQKHFVNQVTVKHGSGIKGFRQLNKLLEFILSLIEKGVTGQDILAEVLKVKEYDYLQPNTPKASSQVKDFSNEIKSAAFLKEALAGAIKCKICGGLIHQNSISVDHNVRKADGGLGILENAQLAHPYCNTTYKN